jgi:predicted DNA-binding transcriptional regulator AlpA
MAKNKSVATSSPAPQSLNPAEILTLEEVAQRLKTSNRWVYEKTRKRCPAPLPVMRIGRYLRFYWPTVAAWLLEHSNGVGA